MLSVLTLLDPSSVHVMEDLKEMAETAQVRKLIIDTQFWKIILKWWFI